MCERELETKQNCNILTPTLLAIIAFLSCSPGLLTREPGAQTWSSIQHLLSNCNCSIGGLRAPSVGCWFSLPHLISNSLDLWLTWTSCSRGYKKIDLHPLLASVTISHSIQPLDSQGYILIFLDRMHLLFTQGISYFDIWSGRRSIYNTYSVFCTAEN